MTLKNPSRRSVTIFISSVCMLSLALAAILALIFGLPHPPTVSVTVSPGGYESAYKRYRYAAVTTDTDICSRIGTDILGEQRGSAVDAAIATFLCVCIVNAQSCGIGGGHIATIYELQVGSTAKAVKTMMAREKAPAAAHRNMFVNDTTASIKGGLSVAVPGEISGFYLAWRQYGRMPWKDLFNESIRLCEEGFIVERALSESIVITEMSVRADPNFRELYVKNDGSLVQTGDLVINQKLGVTLRRIADDPMSFYNGSLARDIIADLQEYGSIIQLSDLERYQSALKDPLLVSLNNGDNKVYSPTAPSSGVVLSFILNILDGYNMTSTDVSDTKHQALTYHRIAEALKFAYAKRSLLGDEDFLDITELISNLTSQSYGQGVRRQIDDMQTHDIGYYGHTFDIVPDSGTAHMNILTQDGAAVSLTGTINLRFGGFVRGRRTGIIFNNEMDDFSTPGTRNAFGVPASPSNYIIPGKMPMSSMCPMIVTDSKNRVKLLSGSSGGTRITTSTAFVAMNSLWFRRDLKTSTDTARIHHQLVPNEISYEKWIDQLVLAELKNLKHNTSMTGGSGVVGTITKSCYPAASSIPEEKTSSAKYCIEAVSDGRKGGTPDGF